MADRFEDLRTFVAVADCGGFAAAADRLGVVKSAVSRRIRELEDRLGSRLFERTTRRIHLTDVGRAFHERAIHLLGALAEAEEEAATTSRDLRGPIRIAAPVSFTTHCLAPVIGRFLDTHPGISLAIDTDDRMVDLVRDGFDLALRIARLPDSALIARRLVTIRHACVASPALIEQLGMPSDPEDLKRYPGITYSNVDESHYWAFADDAVAPVSSRLSFANGDAVREAAIAGVGVAVLPTFIVHEAVRRGELRTLLGDRTRPPIAMSALHPSARNQPARVRALIDFLVETFAGSPFWDRDLPH